MNLLIVDTETTGTETIDSEIIELAAILYNVEEKAIISQISTLFSGVAINNAEMVNKISVEAASHATTELQELSMKFINIDNYDYIVAHNAEFDKKFMRDKLKFESKKPWICTYLDFSWPVSGKKDLVSISLDLGVPVVSAHRALTDCTLLANCFSKLKNLRNFIDEAAKPRNLYYANISFNEKDKAKDLGFIWNSLVPGKWAKKLTEDESKEIPFSLFVKD